MRLKDAASLPTCLNRTKSELFLKIACQQVPVAPVLVKNLNLDKHNKKERRNYLRLYVNILPISKIYR
jgi:hypothetical protein